jgi:virulence factor
MKLVKWRIGIVGLGGIASKAYLPVLSQRSDVEILVCSRTASTVEEVQARYGLSHGTTELDELLSFKPDAAFVLTPSPMHFAVAQKLLDAGVDVFVEKPATLKSQETKALAELAEARGRVLMVGFNRRFAPLHQRARELWAGRTVGLALLQKHRSSAAHPDLFSNYIDDTIHIIDLLRFFCGEGEAVATATQVRDGRLMGAVSIVALEKGGHGVITTSLEAGGWSETYSLHGEGTTLEVDAFSRLRSGGETEERIWREPYASGWKPTLEARGFTQQVNHFFDCLESRQTPLTSAWEAYRTQRLLEDLVACARL